MKSKKPKNNVVYCRRIRRNKQLFKTKEEADRFIKFNESSIRRNGTKHFKHLRSYYCILCGGWHITHLDLSEEEIKKIDDIVDDIIKRATKDTKAKKESKEKVVFDVYEFINGFDLKSFGTRKKFKEYIKENKNLIPSNVKIDKVYHIINNMPPEYFNTLTSDITMSEKEIGEEAQKLYEEIPFSKLKDSDMIENYIKWCFTYKGVNYEVIKKIKRVMWIAIGMIIVSLILFIIDKIRSKQNEQSKLSIYAFLLIWIGLIILCICHHSVD